MKYDWYADRIERYHNGLLRSEHLAQQPPTPGWYNFFEEGSLYATYAEAVGGPKQEVRDIYTGEVAPGRGQAYEVPAPYLALVERLSLGGGQPAVITSLKDLPSYSWGLSFGFRLDKPYVSKDEAPFYVIDNPVRKEKVFKWPLVAATTWKGNLRAALRQEKGIVTEAAEREDAALIRLFGNMKGEEEQAAFCAGRLRFFPTFFAQIGLEIINPHSRTSGAGEQPIYLECVPQGTEGTFTLLYLPFDLLDQSERQRRQEVAADLKTVITTVGALMLKYGFGAKTSSGFGVTAHTITDGHLSIRLGADIVPLPLHSFQEMSALAAMLAQKIQPGGAR